MAIATMQFRVDSTKEVPLDTGMKFKPGARVTILAAGSARYSEDARMHGPSGTSLRRADAPAPHINIGALLVKCGDIYTAVGDALVNWSPPTRGKLEFVYNDRPGMYRDNAGYFSVNMQWDTNDEIPPDWVGQGGVTA